MVEEAEGEPAEPPPPTDTTAPDPDLYFPLEDCAGSRTRKGDSVYISFGGKKNALREDPDIGADDNIIGWVVQGEVLRVVGGPECSLGWILWRVENELMERAWTPESDGDEFWFEIIDSRKVCSGYPESRLHPGDYGHVGLEPPNANHVREEAKNGAKILGKIQPGEQFKVLKGPECASGWVWWYVRSTETGLTGWTAEGDKDMFWLVPEPEE